MRRDVAEHVADNVSDLWGLLFDHPLSRFGGSPVYIVDNLFRLQVEIRVRSMVCDEEMAP